MIVIIYAWPVLRSILYGYRPIDLTNGLLWGKSVASDKTVFNGNGTALRARVHAWMSDWIICVGRDVIVSEWMGIITAKRMTIGRVTRYSFFREDELCETLSSQKVNCGFEYSKISSMFNIYCNRSKEKKGKISKFSATSWAYLYFWIFVTYIFILSLISCLQFTKYSYHRRIHFTWREKFLVVYILL